jgi:selenocysteine lyase/cysteine desulfurase
MGNEMNLSRRNLVLGAGALTAASITTADAQSSAAAGSSTPVALPDKFSFAAFELTYLDSGSQHPMSKQARSGVSRYLAHHAFEPNAPQSHFDEDGVRSKFAKLINAASPDEIAFVQSTTAGEQLVVRGLGLPQTGAHIVTDTLHFFGSLPLYEEMARQGCEVTWVKAVDGRIRLSDVKAAIRKDTKLVSLSHVSTINGFEHDVKAVCDIAHANGAVVYADSIHAVGCVPVDVQASGVDFAACASYKWLMGDFGLGFLYARKEAQARLRRAEYGYEGISTFAPHIYPFDPPGDTIADYAYADSAEGHFAHGTTAFAVAAQLDQSLEYIMGLGVPAIQAHAQTLIAPLKKELKKLGYTVMSPDDAATPHVACALENARENLGKKLADANIHITLSKNRFRVTTSVFNDGRDIERFLSVIGRA